MDVRETQEDAGIGDQVLTAGSGTEVGDVLVVTQIWTAGNAASMGQPSPGTWTMAAVADVGTSSHKVRIWVRPVTEAGSQPITVHAESEFSGVHARLRVVSGADADDPLLDAAGAVGFSSPAALPAPSVDGDDGAMLCCDWAVDDERTFTAPPAGMVFDGDQTTDFLATHGAHEVLDADGATGGRTPTVDDGGSWAATSVTLAPADAAAPHAGAATFAVGVGLSATGGRASSGAAAFAVGAGLTAAGGRESAGAAEFGVGVGLTASGARVSSGTATFAVGVGLSASSVELSRAPAAQTFVVPSERRTHTVGREVRRVNVSA